MGGDQGLTFYSVQLDSCVTILPCTDHETVLWSGSYFLERLVAGRLCSGAEFVCVSEVSALWSDKFGFTLEFSWTLQP